MYTVSERAVATVTDCVVTSIRLYERACNSIRTYTVSERAVAYDMYSVTDCVVASSTICIRYVYTVSERAVATVTDCVVASI